MNPDIIFHLQKIESAKILARQNVETLFSQALLSETMVKELCANLAKTLISEEMLQLAASGQITIAMLRPGADRNIQNMSDAEVETFVQQTVASKLEVITCFSVIFTPDLVEKFYGGNPKEVQMALPAQLKGKHENRWDEFSNLMTSGPSSIILLHDKSGQAVDLWRNYIGHWDVVNRRDQNTLRGMLAVDNYNNLFHGSDSPESVKRELNLISEYLLKIIEIIK